MNRNSIVSHYLLSIDQMDAYINDLSDSDIKKVFEPMNCIGWLLGHCSYYNFSIANKIHDIDIPDEYKGLNYFNITPTDDVRKEKFRDLGKYFPREAIIDFTITGSKKDCIKKIEKYISHQEKKFFVKSKMIKISINYVVKYLNNTEAFH